MKNWKSALTQNDTQKREMGNMTLGKKLIIVFLALSIIPILIVGITNYVEWSTVLENDHIERLSGLAAAKEKTIILYLKDALLQATEFSKDRFVTEALGKINRGDSQAAHLLEELYTYLEFRGSMDADSYEILVINPKGMIIASSTGMEIGESKLDDPYFVGGQKGPYIKDVYLSKTTGKIGFAASAPVKDLTTGEILGVVVTRHPLNRLNQITAENEDNDTGQSTQSELYLVNKDGLMITESKTVKDAPLKQKVSNNLVTLYQTEGKTSQGIYNNYAGTPVVGISKGEALNKEFNLGWVILSEVDKEVVFGPIYKLRNMLIVMIAVTVVVVLIIATSLSNNITGPIRELSGLASQISKGNLDVEVQVKSKDEVGHLASSFRAMTQDLKRAFAERDAQDWLKTGQAELSDKMRGDLGISELARNVIHYLASYLNAQVGAIYVAEGDGRLKLIEGYAYTKSEGHPDEFGFGEGLVGQAAQEKRRLVVSDVPDNYLKVASSWGERVPHNIVLMPFIFDGKVKGVVELGSFDKFGQLQMEFLDQINERIAIAVETVQGNIRTKDLLEETQRQTEELQVQQEELQTANEELEERSKALEKQL